MRYTATALFLRTFTSRYLVSNISTYQKGLRAPVTHTDKADKRKLATKTGQRNLNMAEFPPAPLKKIAEEVAALLRERGETICVAETAAGGLISAALLSTPGASKIYKGGLTVYTLESRIQFAGWQQSDIENYRGPTKQIVSNLAENVREKLSSTYCVSESGTAGPAGGNTPNRTPGYVALAVAHDGGQTTAIEMDTGYGTDRQSNMLAFAVHALKLVKDVIGNRGTKM